MIVSRTMEYLPKTSRTSQKRQFKSFTYFLEDHKCSEELNRSSSSEEMVTNECSFSKKRSFLKYRKRYRSKETNIRPEHVPSVTIEYLPKKSQKSQDGKKSFKSFVQDHKISQELDISSSSDEICTNEYSSTKKKRSFLKYLTRYRSKETKIRTLDYVPSKSIMYVPKKCCASQDGQFRKRISTSNGVTYIKTTNVSRSKLFHSLFEDEILKSQENLSPKKPHSNTDFHNNYEKPTPLIYCQNINKFNRKVCNEYFNKNSINREVGSFSGQSKKTEVNSNKKNVTSQTLNHTQHTGIECFDIAELLHTESLFHDTLKLIENDTSLSNRKPPNEAKQSELINIDKQNTLPEIDADSRNKIAEERHFRNLEKDICLLTRTQPWAYVQEGRDLLGVRNLEKDVLSRTQPLAYVCEDGDLLGFSKSGDKFIHKVCDVFGSKYFDVKNPINCEVGSTIGPNENKNMEIPSNKNNITSSLNLTQNAQYDSTTELMNMESLLCEVIEEDVNCSKRTQSNDINKFPADINLLNLENDVRVAPRTSSNERQQLEFVTIDKPNPDLNCDADSQDSFDSLACINKVLEEGNFLYLLDKDDDVFENLPEHLTIVKSPIEENCSTQTTDAHSWQETQTNSQLLYELNNSPLVTLLENSGRSLESSQRNDVNFISQLFFNDLDTPDEKKENIFEDKFMAIIIESICGTVQNNRLVDHMPSFLNLLDKATDKINSTEEDDPRTPSHVIWDTSRNFDDALSTGSVENFTEAEKKLRRGLNAITMDKSLVGEDDGNIQFVCPRVKKIIVINKIIDLFLKILEDIRQGRSPSFQVRNQCDWNNSVFVNDRLMMKPVGEASMRSIEYYKKTSRSNFKIILFLLVTIVKLLTNNTTCTKREIYYRLVNYVDKQNKVDSAINAVSCMLHEAPWNLGILTTSKGLVYGDLTIFVGDDEVIHCNITGGCLIPQNISKITKIQSDAYFILVIEKDTIFQRLLVDDLPNKLTRPFIMITGKGYSDAHTRLFIKKLCTIMSIPVFLLTDSDPYGIEIMLTYRFGSLNLSHLHDQLAIPNLRWIGVHPSDIINMKLAELPLMPRDIDRINNILKRPYISSYPRIEHELKVSLEGNVKAEIEALFKSDNFLQDIYLPAKFLTQDYI